MEPDGQGALVSTAVAGAHAAPMRVLLDAETSATARVFDSGDPFFIADLGSEAGVSPRLVRETGAVSALWQPVLRDGRPVGVLLVAWERELAHLSDRAAAVVGLFAAEAAVAIERADFLAKLDELNTALAHQVEALRVSDQFKSDFVSSVSHELRTPLASILGYLDILTEGEAGDLSDTQAEFLGIVEWNARRLLTLINDLLTLSGLESGKMIIRPAETDLCEIVRTVVRAQMPSADARSQTVKVDVPPAGLPALVDADRYAQVVTNLLSNAIKFTPDGGVVSVGLCARDGDAELVVSDTGMGIAADDVDRLFERFFRTRDAADGAIPGTGLGLAICRGIVEAHGGQVDVRSEVGAGSQFTVRIPTKIDPTMKEVAA
jgi:two-component system, OmpR family, phosphate regulon sensor histidine kinase PhoR